MLCSSDQLLIIARFETTAFVYIFLAYIWGPHSEETLDNMILYIYLLVNDMSQVRNQI